MPEPFTIRIFVPDGNPEGVRIIDRMNCTGVGIAFPRSRWRDIKNRTEFGKANVYILVGYQEKNDELQTLYIGQGDGIKNRIDSQPTQRFLGLRCDPASPSGAKERAPLGIGFTSNSGGLNRAHITWLEDALINRANRLNRCHLNNSNLPQEPALSESEKADIRGFLKEILQILPLVGLRVFEIPKRVAKPGENTIESDRSTNTKDTVIVPAQQEGFERVFLGENCWHAIRIGGGMLEKN